MQWYVPEYIAVDSGSKTNIKAAHLSEVNRIAMAKK